MHKRKGGLGRGLGSLIPQIPPMEEEPPPQETGTAQLAAQEPATGEAVRTATGAARQASAELASPGPLMIPVDEIEPNPRQPRQQVAAEDLEELAGSIKEHGVLQPILVARSSGGKYTLVAGERRWRAAVRAGLDRVPVIVKEASSREMLELALVENLQRADLNPLEEAQAYNALVEEFGLKQEEVAARVGKSRGAVANSLRLLRLPRPVLQALASGEITEGHARAMLQVPGEKEQLWLQRKIVHDGLNVRQVEALARRMAEHAGQQPHDKGEAADGGLYDELRNLEDRFRNALGTRVQLSRSSRGGKLVIYFYSDEELDRIYGTIIREEDQ